MSSKNNQNTRIKKISNDLDDVQDMMKKNIEGLLERGNKLEEINDRTYRIFIDSQDLKENSRKANRYHYFRMYLSFFVVFMIIIIMTTIKFYFF